MEQRGGSDFQLARGLAEAIGLADHPPITAKTSPYIVNSMERRAHLRRPNHSDLMHIQRQANSAKIRQRKESIRTQELTEREKNTRKNAVKDIFFRLQKPQENPIVYAKTQQIIQRNDAARASKHQQHSQQLRRISTDKSRRSRILAEMMQTDPGWLGQESQKNRGRHVPVKSFFQSGFLWGGCRRREGREQAERLAVSFDLSRFNLVSRQGELHLQSRCEQRKTQTAKSGGRKTVRLRFKQNKCEMLYPNPSQASSIFLPSDSDI